MVKKAAKTLPLVSLITSIVVHAILVSGAAYVTVLVVQGRQKVMFEAKKTPSIPPKKLEHTIRVKQMQQQARKPQLLSRLAANTASKVALPEIPDLAPPEKKDMRDQWMAQQIAGDALGNAGAGGKGAGRGLTGSGGYSDTKFFGENIRTRAIAVLFDVTSTVFDSGAMEYAQEETARLLNSLNPATKFTTIAFTDGAHPFSSNMVFGLQSRKEEVIQWVKALKMNQRNASDPRYTGSTPFESIKLAAELGAETIFIVTDGDLPYIAPRGEYKNNEVKGHREEMLRFAKTLEVSFARPIKIYPVLCYPKADKEFDEAKDFYKKLARATGGRFKIVD